MFTENVKSHFFIAWAVVTLLIQALAGCGKDEMKLSADDEKAVETFLTRCVANAPDFPDSAEEFSSDGYVNKTALDQHLLEKPDGGFAGPGFAGMEGGKENGAEPNGCLVYVPGLKANALAKKIQSNIRKLAGKVSYKKLKGDFYWILTDHNPKQVIAFVAAKKDGRFSGHTLMMISELK